MVDKALDALPAATSSDGTDLYYLVQGGVSKQITGALTKRELLIADRTYYVRTDGSDSNTGLVNTAGGAWLTLQHAYDVIAGQIDTGGNDVTVNVAAGTYGAAVSITAGWTGGGTVEFLGDATTPSNVFISTAGEGFSILVVIPGTFRVKGFKFATGGGAVSVYAPAYVEAESNDYGACTVAHLAVGAPGAQIFSSTNYAITGNTPYHLATSLGGLIYLTGGCNITVSASLTFTAFCYAIESGVIRFGGTPSTSVATGQRYLAQTNGLIEVFGASGGLPGNAAGSPVAGTLGTDGAYVN